MTIGEQLQKIAENVPKVYEKGHTDGYEAGDIVGYERGYTSGHSEGYESGKQAARQSFADIYQQNGTRTVYSRAFASEGWTDELYALMTYPIKPSVAVSMFNNSNITEFRNVDFSNCVGLAELCKSALYLQKVGVIDTRKSAVISNPPSNAYTLSEAFAYCFNLQEIEKMIVHDKMVYPNTFKECRNLYKCIIEGVIGNSIDFGDCPNLSKESVESIFKALSKSSTWGNTLILNSNVKSQFEQTRLNILINSVPNWNISFI